MASPDILAARRKQVLQDICSNQQQQQQQQERSGAPSLEHFNRPMNLPTKANQQVNAAAALSCIADARGLRPFTPHFRAILKASLCWSCRRLSRRMSRDAATLLCLVLSDSVLCRVEVSRMRVLPAPAAAAAAAAGSCPAFCSSLLLPAGQVSSKAIWLAAAGQHLVSRKSSYMAYVVAAKCADAQLELVSHSIQVTPDRQCASRSTSLPFTSTAASLSATASHPHAVRSADASLSRTNG
jgi:hypothetical protein